MKYLATIFILVLSSHAMAQYAVPAMAPDYFTSATEASASSVQAAGLATTDATQGQTMMSKYCSTVVTEALCFSGAALVGAGIVWALKSDKDGQTAAALTPGSTPPGTPAYNAIQPQVAAAQQTAAGMGTTLPALAAQAPSGASGLSGGGGGGTVSAAGTGLPGYGADGTGGAGSDAAGASKTGFRVSSVATDGGGGGGGRGPASASAEPDVNALLAGLKGKNAAGAGLQKSLNGEPIGVASDNIFTKITQAYQAKTTAQTFLPTGN